MNDELKMKVLEYWVNNPEEIGAIPKNLKKKVTEEDTNNLLLEIGAEKLDSSKVFKHLEKVRNKVLQEQTFELQKNMIKTQTVQTWIIIILTIFNVGVGIFSYMSTRIYQEPFLVPFVGYCPEQSYPDVYYTFQFRNNGKSKGSISKVDINSLSSTYSIEPKEQPLSIPDGEYVNFNLIVYPKSDVDDFTFTIKVVTDNNCFQKTCNYEKKAENTYKKINEDIWYGCLF